MKKFNNLGELISYQKHNFNNQNLLSFKHHNQWISFSNANFYELIIKFALVLKKLGIKKGDILANYSYQNPYWLVVDFGAIIVGAITVPIFNNISEDNLFFELQDSGANFLFTDNEIICHKIKERFPQITIITRNFIAEGTSNFDELINSNDFNNINFDLEIANFIAQLKNNEIATIVYTSGSTGFPKGVEVSHEALVSQIHDADEFFKLKSQQKVLSYLPLAHIFERMVMMYYISKNLSIYFVDDIKNLAEFLNEIRPNLMTSVPRALEKVFAKINNKIDEESFIKKFIAKSAISRALTKNPQSSKNFLDKIFDKIIYKKLRLVLGGKIEMIICGGSALSQDLERFYWNIGVKIYCGYGLTECSPVLATNCPAHYKFATIGKAFPSVQLKIADDGELFARGINVMKNYHNNPQKTAEVFSDGWFKTGDLAQIDDEGYVKIIGRKKEVFKTSNGKFVHPNFLEQKLVQEIGFLVGALIIAESRSFVSAMLFIDFDLIKNIKNKLNFHSSNNQNSDEEFLNSSILYEFIDKKIITINKNLDNWEQIKKFKIISQKISIETGEITPSMKLKRNILEQKFSQEIADIYLDK